MQQKILHTTAHIRIYRTIRKCLISIFDLHFDVCDIFFIYRVELSFSYSLKKNPTRLFFGKYVGSQGEDLIVEPKSFFLVLLAISSLYSH